MDPLMTIAACTLLVLATITVVALRGRSHGPSTGTGNLGGFFHRGSRHPNHPVLD